MRSRYSAYTMENFDYIEQTCAGPAAKAFNRLEAQMSAMGTQWLGLTITDTKAGGEQDKRGTVSFTFRCMQNGQLVTASELSAFRKVDGRWVYWDRVG
jgi:SEC-C motif-containing protein